MRIKPILPASGWGLVVLGLLILPPGCLHAVEGYAFPLADKIVHGGLFLVFGALLAHGFHQQGSRWQTLLRYAGATLITGTSFGLVTEWMQLRYVAGRSGSLGDVAADIAGTAFGVLCFHRLICSPRLRRLSRERFPVTPTAVPRSAEFRLMAACLRRDAVEYRRAAVTAILNQPVDWDALFMACARQGLYPLVYEALNDLEHPSIPPSFLERMKRAVVANRLNMVRLGDEMIRVSGLFRDHGLRALPLKGPALALQIFRDLGLRTSVDLDFYVATQDLPAAGDLLLKAGYVRVSPKADPTPRQYRHLLRTTFHFLYRHPVQKCWLELHWRLDQQNHLPLDFDTVWSRAVEMSLVQPPLRVPGREDLFLYLAFHGSMHQWQQLKWLADLAALLRPEQGLEIPVLAARAEELKQEAVLGQALRLLRDVAGIPLPPTLAERFADQEAARVLANLAMGFITQEKQDLGISGRRQDLMYRFRSRGFGRLLLLKYVEPDARLYQAVKLPDLLHPLYYVLNPFFRLWVLVRRTARRRQARYLKRAADAHRAAALKKDLARAHQPAKGSGLVEEGEEGPSAGSWFDSPSGRLDVTAAVLAQGKPIRFRAQGVSMMPFIRNNDVLTITPLEKQEAPQPGQVVACRHPSSPRLVVHRVVAVDAAGQTVLLRGDNCSNADGTVTWSDLLGRVTAVERKGRQVWLGLGPERRLIAGLSVRGRLASLIQRVGNVRRRTGAPSRGEPGHSTEQA